MSSSTPPGAETRTANLIAVFSSIIVIVCVISSMVFLSVGYACGWFSHKHRQSRASKTAITIIDSTEKNACSNEGSQTPAPIYEELHKPEHQDLVELKENVAYGPISK